MCWIYLLSSLQLQLSCIALTSGTKSTLQELSSFLHSTPSPVGQYAGWLPGHLLPTVLQPQLAESKYSKKLLWHRVFLLFKKDKWESQSLLPLSTSYWHKHMEVEQVEQAGQGSGGGAKPAAWRWRAPSHNTTLLPTILLRGSVSSVPKPFEFFCNWRPLADPMRTLRPSCKSTSSDTSNHETKFHGTKSFKSNSRDLHWRSLLFFFLHFCLW